MPMRFPRSPNSYHQLWNFKKVIKKKRIFLKLTTLKERKECREMCKNYIFSNLSATNMQLFHSSLITIAEEGNHELIVQVSCKVV